MPIEIREARPEEYAETGVVTANAYREFFSETEPHSYLEEIADVAGRAPRTTILVAVDGDRIVGSATLELDGRTSEDAGPLAPDEAHIRMLGVDPDDAAGGRGEAADGCLRSAGTRRRPHPDDAAHDHADARRA